MVDDRLPCCRWESISATNSDKFFCRLPAISFRPSQNASSRLTLVLWPATTTERLTTGDFIEATPVCTENLIRIDCVTESPNVNGDDRALLPLFDPVRLAVQVEEPT